MKSTPINYFEYVDETYKAEKDERLTEVAQGLFNEISEFYTFLIESIDEDDYTRMKSELGYTESYEDHINSLTDGVPSPEKSIEQITEFLNTYREFVDKEYITVLKQLNTRIQMNREMCKMQAYQILQQQSTQLQDSQKNMERGMTQGKIEALIGGKVMSFDTHNNPLLVSLYSLLLVWFSLKHYGEPPKPVVYTETDEEAERLNNSSGKDE